ncbi:hypothetical protein AAC387_Pa09g2114 [Persea americana]
MSLHHLTTRTPLSTSSPNQKHQSKRLHQKHPAVYTGRRTKGWCSSIRSSSGAGENAGEEQSDSSKRVDRRDVLLGLGGLYGAAGLAGQALTSPVGIPDRNACGSASSANIKGPLMLGLGRSSSGRIPTRVHSGSGNRPTS